MRRKKELQKPIEPAPAQEKTAWIYELGSFSVNGPNTFGFNQEAVKSYIDGLENPKDKVTYLSWVLDEFRAVENLLQEQRAKMMLEMTVFGKVLTEQVTRSLKNIDIDDEIKKRKKELKELDEILSNIDKAWVRASMPLDMGFPEFVNTELKKLEPRQSKKPVRRESVIDWKAILEKVDPNKKYYAKELADLCGVAKQTVYGWTKKGLSIGDFHLDVLGGRSKERNFLKQMTAVKGFRVYGSAIIEFAKIQISGIEEKNS